MRRVITTKYKGAKYMYRPALDEVHIRYRGMTYVTPILPSADMHRLWDTIREPLRDFWRQVMRYAWNAEMPKD